MIKTNVTIDKITKRFIRKAIQANEKLIAEITERAKALGMLSIDGSKMIAVAHGENRAFQAVLNSLKGNHKDLERYGE